MNRCEFSVSGYDIVEYLGSGGSGEVWLAREVATGDPVAVKRIPLTGAERSGPGSGSDPGPAVAAMQREAAVLSGLDHPHVMRLRRVIGTGEGLILVLDFAGGGSLADLIAARGPITAGEIVTMAAPIAQALGAAHALGVVHGDLSPANILFTSDGRPLLADLGVASLVGEAPHEVSATRRYLDPAVRAGTTPGPSSDVYGLAAVCQHALTGSRRAGFADPARSLPAAHAALQAVLTKGLDPSPDQRPSAAAFALALYEAATPQPVRLVATRCARQPVTPGDADLTRPVRRRPPAASDAPPPRGHRRPRAGPGATPGRARKRTGLVLVALGILGSLIFGGLRLLGGESAAAALDEPAAAPRQAAPVTVAAPTPRGEPDWKATLDALDLRRSQAFANGDAAALEQVYAEHAPALARDRALLRQLLSAGARARGLRLTINSVEPVMASQDRAVLRVSDKLPTYSVVDVSGAQIEQRPGRGDASWEVTLLRSRGAWRVFDVVRARA